MTRLPTVTARQVLAALHRAGFALDRSKGGHRLLIGPAGHRVVVPFHPHDDIAPGTLRNILRQAGLTAEEFQALL